MLIGYILAIIGICFINIPIWLALLLLLHMGIDGVGQFYGRWKSSNTRRYACLKPL